MRCLKECVSLATACEPVEKERFSKITDRNRYFYATLFYPLNSYSSKYFFRQIILNIGI